MADNMDLVTKNADALTLPSRAFYERSIFKLFLSIVYASISLFFLGLCAQGKLFMFCFFNYLLLRKKMWWIFCIFVSFRFVFLAGGRCNASVYQAKDASDNNLNSLETIYHYMALGYGFATFFYFVAFAIAIACAFHISPLTNG